MSFERVKFFVSYRHIDGEQYAEKIRQKLKLTEPSCKVYLDKYEMVGASSFIYQIKEELEKADLIILLITPFWNTKEGKKRLFNSEDIQYREISFALRNKKPILPILIDEAKMPEAEDLPEDIYVLNQIHAVKLSLKNFDDNFKIIVSSIIQVLSYIDEMKDWRDKRFSELDDLLKNNPKKFEIEFQKEFDKIKDELPKFLHVKSKSGEGFKESLINLFGIWESVANFQGNKLWLEYNIINNKYNTFKGKIKLTNESGQKIRNTCINGTWTRAMDIDKNLFLGFFLSYVAEDNNNHEEIIIPFHQRIGNSIVGIDSQGLKFVNTIISQRFEGF